MTGRPRPTAPTGDAPELRRGRLLRGGNVHHRSTVFSQRVQIGTLSGLHVADVGADFAARFIERFDNLGGLPTKTVAALHDVPGPTLTEALLQAILATERWLARAKGRLDEPQFAAILPADGGFELVWDSDSAGTSRAAARVAFAGLIELLPADLIGDANAGPDSGAMITKLLRWCRRRQWTPATAVLAKAARQSGLHHEVIAGSYLRLGTGVAQQVVSESALGIFPRPELGAGRIKARRRSRAVGDDKRVHRLLVVGARLVSALRFDPPAITGDGTSSIRQLIQRLNDDPRRDGIASRKIPLQARLRSGLAALDLDLDDVLPRDRRLTLPGVRTFERGAAAVDVTEQVHQSVRETAILAARDHARPIVSVEFATSDITSRRHGRGRVLATSPSTDLYVHARASDRGANRVGHAALDLVFPVGAAAWIPTVLVIGEHGTRSVARALDRLLRNRYQGVGLALGRQTTVHGQPLDPTSIGRRHGLEFLLGDPRVDVAISAASPRTIVRRGLQLERFTAIALLDPRPDGDLETCRASLAVSLTGTTDTVVIGADHPYASLVLDAVGPARVLLVTGPKAHRRAERHLAAGGAVVSPAPGRHPDSIELRRGDATIASLPLASLRATRMEAAGPGSLGAPLYAAGLTFALEPARHRDGEAAAAPEPERLPAGTAPESRSP